MIHRYTMKGMYFILDVNSGAVHLVDEVAYAVSGLLTSDMGAQCPPRIFQSLPQYPHAEVGTAYAELYGLYLNGQLFSKDDYLEASKYIPAARRSRRCACMSRTTATCGASIALRRPATLARGAKPCRLRSPRRRSILWCAVPASERILRSISSAASR